MNRRTFLKGTTAAAAVGLTRRTPEPLMNRIGVQLYSVRNLMQEDLPGTLEKIAQIGFHELEFAGHFGHTARQVRQWVEDHGLSAPSAHIPFEMVRDNLSKVREDAEAMLHRFVVVPWMTEDMRTPEGTAELIDVLNKAGEELAKSRIILAYHNHEFEFEQMGDTTMWDMIIKETDPKLVRIELDLYWSAVAKQDSAAIIKDLGERALLFHMKDMDAKGEMAPVGDGTVDFKTLAGLTNQYKSHYFVEHDHAPDPLASLTKSFNYLSNLEIG